VRESIPEANRRIGAIASHDIAANMRVNCFGHLGDGNLHYNVFPARGRSRVDYESLRDRIKETVHDLTHAHGGTISAEHGIGRFKTGDLLRYSDPGKLAAMRAVKHALDPFGILNPGAVIA
jgi:FAD/FMN-containing dehydrogenase